MFGRADTPVADGDFDRLDLRKYARALANFVLRCETPMTVGIQGEWGSGKTSLMWMVQEELRRQKPEQNDEATPPWLYTFETWQHGAVGDDSRLGVELLHGVTQRIVEVHSDDGVIAQLGTKLNRVTGLLKAVAAGAINQATQGLVDGGTLMGGGVDSSSVLSEHLSQLKRRFQELIDRAVQQSGNPDARFILFVDDLDRISPDRAVSLLEVLKNFMDVSHCVFIVACDYDVVRSGVRQRFGIEDEEKARAFFDKIIQVPFRMPTSSYDISGLFEDYLKAKVGRKRDQQKLARVAKDLSPMVQIATGANPRAFKRFLNSLDLHACVGTFSADEPGDLESMCSASAGS